MPEFAVSDLTLDETARIVKSVVTPRPIAWISTVDAAGHENLAPFSSYNYVGSSTPVVVFNSPNASTGRQKDTSRNAVETGEFAVNVVTAAVLEAMDRTSASLPPEESEFDVAGIDREACVTIAPPRVAGAVATMECTLYDAIEVHDRLMVLGDVQYFHLSEEIMRNGQVDSRVIDTVGRLGGPFYTVSEPIAFERQF